MEKALYANLLRRPWHQFHLQQNTTPHRLRLILERDFTSASVEFGVIGTRDLIRGFLRGLDILTEQGELTEHGKRLQALNVYRPDLLSEAIHVWLRCHALTDDPPRFALAYDALCNFIYCYSGSAFDNETLLAETRTFLRGRMGMYDNEIAFSLNSIKGAMYWLTDLRPQFITTNGTETTFSARQEIDPIVIEWIASFFAQTAPLNSSSETGAAFFARLLLADQGAVAPILETVQTGALQRSASAMFAQWNKDCPIGELRAQHHA